VSCGGSRRLRHPQPGHDFGCQKLDHLRPDDEDINSEEDQLPVPGVDELLQVGDRSNIR
jgi:hypothetical protein